MQKVFYSHSAKHTITDVSGNKTIDQIKAEFGNYADLQEIEIDPEIEAVKAQPNGDIEKYNRKDETAVAKAAKKAAKDEKEARLKTQLSLSDSDWNDLKEALR
tara:strand:- start:302 stop:610 length:309 start_codon:yes stop_codon:yes gene_type:complete